jgi:hypothetical protein
MLMVNRNYKNKLTLTLCNRSLSSELEKSFVKFVVKESQIYIKYMSKVKFCWGI